MSFNNTGNPNILYPGSKYMQYNVPLNYGLPSLNGSAGTQFQQPILPPPPQNFLLPFMCQPIMTMPTMGYPIFLPQVGGPLNTTFGSVQPAVLHPSLVSRQPDVADASKPTQPDAADASEPTLGLCTPLYIKADEEYNHVSYNGIHYKTLPSANPSHGKGYRTMEEAEVALKALCSSVGFSTRTPKTSGMEGALGKDVHYKVLKCRHGSKACPCQVSFRLKMNKQNKGYYITCPARNDAFLDQGHSHPPAGTDDADAGFGLPASIKTYLESQLALFIKYNMPTQPMKMCSGVAREFSDNPAVVDPETHNVRQEMQLQIRDYIQNRRRRKEKSLKSVQSLQQYIKDHKLKLPSNYVPTKNISSVGDLVSMLQQGPAKQPLYLDICEVIPDIKRMFPKIKQEELSFLAKSSVFTCPASLFTLLQCATSDFTAMSSDGSHNFEVGGKVLVVFGPVDVRY